MVGRKYGYLRWEGIESAVADAEASKNQALVWFKVFVEMAYRRTPIVGHLLIEGEVAL